jgi:three-Cys-motif partner protein
MAKTKPQRRGRISLDSEADGLPVRTVKPYSHLKYESLAHYDSAFSTGMKERWKNRVYLDLYAGPGKSQIEGSERILLGSPLIALSVPDPFDKYIFCESDPTSLGALRKRVDKNFPGANVEYVAGACGEKVDEIIQKIPTPSEGTVLTFCFADPTDLSLTFDMVRTLKTARFVDFLVLLASEMDGRRNEHNYIKRGGKIASFLDDEGWKDQWKVAEEQGEGFGTFLLKSFANKMIALGYLADCKRSMITVRATGRKVDIYRLAYFSCHQLGYKLWRDARTSASNLELEFPN